jgi:hypothetical protein
MGKIWKEGSGKLGLLQPLLGRWTAVAESEIGAVRCTRVFEPVLGGSYIRLEARWEFGGGPKPRDPHAESSLKGGQVYEELALIGVDDGGEVRFWSFTSDGRRSQGTLVDVMDLHEEAVGFEAQMPAGLARMVYWPHEDGGFVFVVESRDPDGWNRFVEHHYHRA